MVILVLLISELKDTHLAKKLGYPIPTMDDCIPVQQPVGNHSYYELKRTSKYREEITDVQFSIRL